jgi:hypothetical protein
MRWFVGLILMIIILAMIAWAVATGFDRGVATAIERSAERRLGVPVEVAAADTGLMSEQLQISGLRIANPEGFEQPDFLTLGQGRIQVSARSLMGDQAQIHEIALHDIDLVLARSEDGRINYRVIMENLDQASPDPATEEAGTRFEIARLLIRDVDIAFTGIPVVGDQGMHIEQIEVTEIGDDLSSGDIAALVVREILEEVVAQGGPLPADLRDALKDQLGDVRELLSGVAGRVGGSAAE